MDRAHRIGQKRMVNVYRLVTADSIEERIMSLQTFKLHTARTVVSEDNRALVAMDTGRIFDHLGANASVATPSTSRQQGAEEQLFGDLEAAQYAEAFDMDAFVARQFAAPKNDQP